MKLSLNKVKKDLKNFVLEKKAEIDNEKLKKLAKISLVTLPIVTIHSQKVNAHNNFHCNDTSPGHASTHANEPNAACHVNVKDHASCSDVHGYTHGNQHNSGHHIHYWNGYNDDNINCGHKSYYAHANGGYAHRSGNYVKGYHKHSKAHVNASTREVVGEGDTCHASSS